ncbi:MAG: type IV pilin, partial [Methanobacteriota archaeon]
MRHIIREDDDAVSPVIATILMVAITVVLAAVLYVMVSGLITGPGSTPQSM